jgi:hypothetical protein
VFDLVVERRRVDHRLQVGGGLAAMDVALEVPVRSHLARIELAEHEVVEKARERVGL